MQHENGLVVYAKKVIYVTLCTFENACISQISRRPIEIRTASLAMVGKNANGREQLIIRKCFKSVAQQ